MTWITHLFSISKIRPSTKHLQTITFIYTGAFSNRIIFLSVNHTLSVLLQTPQFTFNTQIPFRILHTKDSKLFTDVNKPPKIH